MKEARNHHSKHIKILMRHLKSNANLKIKKPEVTGSSYEDVSVDECPEFDVMVIMDGKDVQLEELSDQHVVIMLDVKRQDG